MTSLNAMVSMSKVMTHTNGMLNGYENKLHIISTIVKPVITERQEPLNSLILFIISTNVQNTIVRPIIP